MIIIRERIRRDSCRCAGSACARVPLSCSRPRGTRRSFLSFFPLPKGGGLLELPFFYPPHVRDCRAVRSFVPSTRVPHRPPDSAPVPVSFCLCGDRVPPVEFVNAVCALSCVKCVRVSSLFRFFFPFLLVDIVPPTLYSSRRHSSSCGSPSRRPAERMDWAVSCALCFYYICCRDVIVGGRDS